MQKLTNEELCNINGGGISGAFLNYATKAFDLIYNLGRALGSSIRRIGTNGLCPVK